MRPNPQLPAERKTSFFVQSMFQVFWVSVPTSSCSINITSVPCFQLEQRTVIFFWEKFESSNSWRIFYQFLFITTNMILCVLIISRTRFRVNSHSIVAWMSRNSFHEAGAKSEGVPWHSGNYRVWIYSETRT